MKRASIILFAILALVSSISCRREPLHDSIEVDGFKLVIRPRWIELEERPTGMTAFIYPTAEGEEPIKIISQNVDSIATFLPAGGYRILLFNQTVEEFPSLTFRHMESYYDSEIIVNEDTKHTKTYDIFSKSQMSVEPEVFAMDCCNELNVTQEEIVDARTRKMQVVKTLTMRPHIIISTLYITVPVMGIYNAWSASGCIDGMSRHIFQTYYETGESLASQIIPTWTPHYKSVSSNEGSFTASCRTMGFPGTSLYLASAASIETTERPIRFKSQAMRSKSDPQFKPEDIRLHMKVLLADKKTIKDTIFLVGDQIERRLNDPLILDLVCRDTLYLPYVKPEGTGSAAFDVVFDDWIEVSETISF